MVRLLRPLLFALLASTGATLFGCADATPPPVEEADAASADDAPDYIRRDAGGADEDATAGTPDATGDGFSDTSGGDPGTYEALCASCHGATGDGGTGPALIGWSRDRSVLVSAIDERMPPTDPTRCEGECAERLADEILSWAGPSDCESAPRVGGEQTIRLLTPSEYSDTIRDLLGARSTSGEACEGWRDCDARAEGCVGGACAPLACGSVRFTYTPTGPVDAVHVAGSFNAWAATVGEGGWAMNRDGDVFWTERDVGAGTFEYKFVVQSGGATDWIADPSADASSPDGFGGENSVLVVDACEGAGSTGETAWSASLPSAVRPEGFAFETHAASGHATSAHVETHLANARLAAAEALARRADWLPCDTNSTACADEIARSFGRRAFRRPLTDEEAARYRDLITSEGSFDAGLTRALEQLFVSPHFLYRFELGEEQADGSFLLTGFELASLLSYTLWGTTPDDALLDAAERGDLDTEAGLRDAAERLLGDPRARSRLGLFAEQWLGIEDVTQVARDALTPALRQSLIDETRALVTHVAFDGTGRFPELFLADYTFANEALGELYGVDLSGSALQRVDYPDGRRSGLLGHASILTSTAHSDQTSPIRRGLWVRQRVLCQEFGAPPPSAGGVPEVDPSATTRERFRQHTDDPFCSSCHQYIDDLGFGFEHFDSLGRWRETEFGAPIDARGDLNDVEGFGTDTTGAFETLPQLAEIITASERARACFQTQYYRFAHGRAERPADRCTLDDIDARFVDADQRIDALILATVTHPSFRRRQ